MLRLRRAARWLSHDIGNQVLMCSDRVVAQPPARGRWRACLSPSRFSDGSSGHGKTSGHGATGSSGRHCPAESQSAQVRGIGQPTVAVVEGVRWQTKPVWICWHWCLCRWSPADCRRRGPAVPLHRWLPWPRHHEPPLLIGTEDHRVVCRFLPVRTCVSSRWVGVFIRLGGCPGRPDEVRL